MIHDSFLCDIYFIRHGESESNVVTGMAAGVNFDAPMTERGHRQARALGKRLGAEGVEFDRIYSSSMTRAVQTAQGMLEGMGIPDTQFRRADEIIELQVPGWRGKRQVDVITPEVALLQVTKGKWFVPPDGESERMVERRFSNWIEDEVTNNPDFAKLGRQTIAIVSHGLALKCLFHYILGYNDRFIRQFVIDNTAISRFRFTSTGWFLVSLNDASHTWELGDVNREKAMNITP